MESPDMSDPLIIRADASHQMGVGHGQQSIMPVLGDQTNATFGGTAGNSQRLGHSTDTDVELSNRIGVRLEEGLEISQC